MPRAPRVLFVTHNVPRFEGDAAGSFVLRLAVGLQELGARVHVIAPGAAGLAPQDTIEGVSITRVRYAPNDQMTLAYTGNMAEAVRASWSGRWALLQLLRATRTATRRALAQAKQGGDPFDVVHVHWWFPSGLATWKLRGRADAPMVITMHGSDVRLAANTPVAHPIMRSVLADAQACTVVSSWLGAMVLQIAPTVRADIEPMPVDTRLFLGQAPETRSGILFVGRLNAQKGLGDLLKALALPPLSGTMLHVIGDGPDRDHLAALAGSLGVADRVTWHGSMSQQALAPMYHRARAVVMPSRGEGLGLVAVEAQLCGTPVIAYADGGLPDIVRPEHGGTLVETGNTTALATSIARVVASDETIAELGGAAHAAMTVRFAPASVAARYLRIYESVANRIGTSAARGGNP